ncbi:unnamed protein product [Urochloa decumbens]|uniref:DUF569 domain-containing protein n=1 Tax=Urochloa decumbens TaxID=240449 RepID=A0ABC9DUR8_9POAL
MAAAPAPDAMQQFPEGAHVRLRSRVHGGYLHADEDGVGVSLRWRRRGRGSVGAAWRVERILHDGATCVLLHSAAYGRYLAASPEPAPPGHRGHRVVQGEHGEHGVDPILWKPVGSGHAGYVLLRHVSYRLLRANGRYRLWHAGVSVDDFDNQSTMMHWKVEAIPPRSAPPALPPPAPVSPPCPHSLALLALIWAKRGFLSTSARCFINRGGFRGLFLLHEEPAVLQRTIRYVRADNQGNFNLNPNGWATFQFHGRSVFHLRSEVANHVGLALFFFRVIVCVRAGRYGQPTPLLIDLPRNEETLDVVAIVSGTAGEIAFAFFQWWHGDRCSVDHTDEIETVTWIVCSIAAAALRYPDVDAR